MSKIPVTLFWCLRTPCENLFCGEEIKENRAVRAMLIGPGGAGKTSLWQLLTKGKVDEKIAVTRGVEYQNHESVKLSIHEKALQGVEDWKGKT